MSSRPGVGSNSKHAGGGPMSALKSDEYRIQPAAMSAVNINSTVSPGCGCAGVTCTAQWSVSDCKVPGGEVASVAGVSLSSAALARNAIQRAMPGARRVDLTLLI